MAAAIEIQGLTKRYKNPLGGEVTALNGLDLSVLEGEIFGFLGPNGAGKTTTIKILLGLLFPTSGKAQVLGKPAGDIDTKSRISYLPESPYFYEHMTTRELLCFYADLFKIKGPQRKKKIDELIEMVGLTKAADKPLRQYSKGMLQRAGLAQALLNDPDLVFLDEPTSGLDPIAHSDICKLILSLKEQGKTVLVCSHQLSDIEMIGDRVGILVGGKLAMVGEVKELLTTDQIEVHAVDVSDDAGAQIKPLSDEFDLNAGRLTVFVKTSETLNKVMDILLKSGASIVSVNPRRRTLEKLFVDTVRGGR